MKYVLLAAVFALASLLFALDGQIGIHDPSTVVRCNGRYYTYGTGGSSLISDDGWRWKRGTALPRRGLAPDVIHLGDRYYLYIAANIGAQPKAAVNMISNKTLDPDSPDYKWEEGSKRLTLNKGANIVRAAIINGGGATDFCARFLGPDDKPVRALTVSLAEAAK